MWNKGSLFLYRLQNTFPKNLPPSENHFSLLQNLAFPEHLISNQDLEVHKDKNIFGGLVISVDEEMAPKLDRKRISNNDCGDVESSEETLVRSDARTGSRSAREKSLKTLQNIIQKSCVPAAYVAQQLMISKHLRRNTNWNDCDVEKFLRSEAAYTKFYVRKRHAFTQLPVLAHDLNENWRMEVS